MFGEGCTFAHGSYDLSENVRLCDFGKECRYGEYCVRRHLKEKIDVKENCESVNKKQSIIPPNPEDIKTITRKTVLCEKWCLNKECEFGNDCAFAHGSEDYNLCVKKCEFFNGNRGCKNGDYCKFSHQYERDWLYKPIEVCSLSIAQKKDLLRFLECEIARESEEINVIM